MHRLVCDSFYFEKLHSFLYFKGRGYLFFVKLLLPFRSPEWEKIDQNDRKKVGLTFEEDGEFW